MDFIIDFYKELDTINLIIFWGIIIVIFLLLIFSIIIVNKNKKLKIILKEKELEENSKEEIIPIITEIKNEKSIIEKKNINDIIDTNDIKEEKNFIAEEHIIEHNKELFSQPNLVKKEIEKSHENIQEISKPINKHLLYQKNILKEISSNQTSPIGIIKKTEKEDIEKEKARELHESLIGKTEIINEKSELKQEQINKNHNNEYKKVTVNQSFNLKNEKNANTTKKNDYVKEIAKKLADAKKQEDIERTEYELKQEEEAIISYEELMRKKDSIKIIDEEEAVISIEELIKKNEKKTYNLTEEEENDKFLNELKKFRKEL